jgi:hypothetical protein
MIRIDDPAGLGAALGQVRAQLQIGRRELARRIAEATGRDASAVNSQLWGWEHGDYAPNPTSLGPLLDALGYQLALVPLIEDGPETAPASTLSDQGAEMHTRVGVDHSEGAQAISDGSRPGHLPHCDGFFGGRCEPDCPMHHNRTGEQP